MQPKDLRAILLLLLLLLPISVFFIFILHQRKLDEKTEQRPIRKKTKIDRFKSGRTDLNYNDFIDELDELGSENSIETTTKTTSTPKETLDNGKCDCTCSERLNLLLNKTDLIHDYLIKLDVKINNMDSTPSSTQNVVKLGNIDMDQLRQFGLPLESETELENLNKRLKNDFEFKTKLVSIFQF